jgi:hypothetical protein
MAGLRVGTMNRLYINRSSVSCAAPQVYGPDCKRFALARARVHP